MRNKDILNITFYQYNFFLQLTSQHPYAEVYIGKPHVWTVDINDLSEVEKAVKSILNQKVRNVSSICYQQLRVQCVLHIECFLMLV